MCLIDLANKLIEQNNELNQSLDINKIFSDDNTDYEEKLKEIRSTLIKAISKLSPQAAGMQQSHL